MVVFFFFEQFFLECTLFLYTFAPEKKWWKHCQVAILLISGR